MQSLVVTVDAEAPRGAKALIVKDAQPLLCNQLLFNTRTNEMYIVRGIQYPEHRVHISPWLSWRGKTLTLRVGIRRPVLRGDPLIVLPAPFKEGK